LVGYGNPGFRLSGRCPAYHITSGGVGGSEGAIALALEGEEKKVEKAFELAKSVKGEPPVTMPKQFKVSSPADYQYDA